MGGRLEHEIRLLPQVLSCSFSQDDYVVVLIDPSGDPWTIQLAVERILQNAGSEATVLVIDPKEATAAAATRTISPLMATATAATVAAIGFGALVGGLAAVQHPDVTHQPPAAPAAAAPFDTLDTLHGLQFTPSVPAPGEAAALPVEAPDRTRQASAATFVSGVRAASPRGIGSHVRPVHARSAGEPEEDADLGHGSHKGHDHHGRHFRHRAHLLSQSVFFNIRHQKEKGPATR